MLLFITFLIIHQNGRRNFKILFLFFMLPRKIKFEFKGITNNNHLLLKSKKKIEKSEKKFIQFIEIRRRKHNLQIFIVFKIKSLIEELL